MSTNHERTAAPAVHNIGAEQALIGCVLRRDVAYFDVHNALSAGDFFDLRHRIIWETISKIASARKGKFNATTVADYLRNEDGSESVPRDYLEALVDAVADPAGLQGYLSQVVEHARTRRMILALRDAERKLMTRDPEQPLNDIVDDINADVLTAGRMDATTTRTLSSFAEDIYIRLDEVRLGRQRTPYLRWGLQAMDDACGPATPGHLHVIGGRPEMGKTALALGVALHFGTQAPGAIIELEMTGDGLATRAISRLSAIEAGRISRNETYDMGSMDAVGRAIGKLSQLPIQVIAKPGLSFEQIRARCIGLARTHGCRWFIVDHLQIIAESYRRQDEAQIIGNAAKGFVELAKELDAVFVALSQVNSKNRDRDYDRPQSRDLYQYNAIEPNADMICFPYRPEVALREKRPPQPIIGDAKMEAAMLTWEQAMDAARGKAEIICTKNRHGESGIWRDCEWQGKTMEFTALSWDREAARKREAQNRNGW